MTHTTSRTTYNYHNGHHQSSTGEPVTHTTSRTTSNYHNGHHQSSTGKPVSHVATHTTSQTTSKPNLGTQSYLSNTMKPQMSTYAYTNSTMSDDATLNQDELTHLCPTSFRRHPRYCNLFFQCLVFPNGFDIQTSTFQCPEATIYDRTKIQCVYSKDATHKCSAGIYTEKLLKSGSNRKVKYLQRFRKLDNKSVLTLASLLSSRLSLKQFSFDSLFSIKCWAMIHSVPVKDHSVSTK